MSDQNNHLTAAVSSPATALGAAAAATGTLAMPSILRAQGGAVKLGVCIRSPARCLIPASKAGSAPPWRSRKSTRPAASRGSARSSRARRRAVDARRRHRRSREDEFGRRRLRSSAAMPASSASPPRRPRRAMICRMSSTSASPTAIVTRGLKNTFRFGPGFGVIAKTALDQSRRDQRSGRQAGQDRDDRPRGFAVRLRPCQAAQCAAAAARLSRSWRRSRIRRRRATSTTSCSRSRRRIRTSSFRRTTTTNMCCSRAPCSSSK